MRLVHTPSVIRAILCLMLFPGVPAGAQMSQTCTDSTRFDPSRTLVGVFEEPGIGRATLLFCTGKDGTVTSMFSPPRFLGIHEQSNRANGDVQLRSDVFGGDRFYDFKGRKLGREIVGQLQLRSAKDDAIVLSGGLTLKRVSDLLHSGKGVFAKLMHYSNAEFIQESGDIIGAEIWVASTRRSAIGFVVFYESYWGEPTQVPLAMEELRRDSSTLAFELQTPETNRYHLKTAPGKATLSRSDQPKSTESSILLKAAPTLGRYPSK